MTDPDHEWLGQIYVREGQSASVTNRRTGMAVTVSADGKVVVYDGLQAKVLREAD